jgi:hypothetical protein
LWSSLLGDFCWEVLKIPLWFFGSVVIGGIYIFVSIVLGVYFILFLLMLLLSFFVLFFCLFLFLFFF